MSTPRPRSLVSLAAAAVLAVSVTLGACATAPSRGAAERLAAAEGAPRTVIFDNEAGDFVHVYLVGQRRQWLLGRVEAGARSTLRIPAPALDEDAGWLRVAVVAGSRVSARAIDEPRAQVGIAQPAHSILAQRWTFARSVATARLVSADLRPPARGGARP